MRNKEIRGSSTHLDVQCLLVDSNQTVSDLCHAEDLDLVQNRANALVLVNVVGGAVNAKMRQVKSKTAIRAKHEQKHSEFAIYNRRHRTGKEVKFRSQYNGMADWKRRPRPFRVQKRHAGFLLGRQQAGYAYEMRMVNEIE